MSCQNPHAFEAETTPVLGLAAAAVDGRLAHAAASGIADPPSRGAAARAPPLDGGDEFCEWNGAADATY